MSKIVLHVDDSATMQMVADITFRGTEYTCVAARSVDEALEKARAQRPTLVLADAQMPGKTGYDLCMALKSDPKFAEVPVVILCGNAQPFDATRGGQVGADGTLPKPWDTQVMLEKVAEAIDKAAAGVAKPGGAAGAAAAPVAAAAPAASAPAVAAAAAPAPTAPSALAAAAAANKGVPQPPRSATIMGMPTIKMPAGTAPTVPVTSATPPAAVAPAAAARPPGPAVVARQPAAPVAAPIATPVAAPAAAPVAAPVAAPAPVPVASASPSFSDVAKAAPSAASAPARAPMVAGTASKRSALVERTLAKMAARLAEASGLEPGSPELMALLKLSTEVVERVVWEVVPELAEQLIRENLEQLAAARRN